MTRREYSRREIRDMRSATKRLYYAFNQYQFARRGHDMEEICRTHDILAEVIRKYRKTVPRSMEPRFIKMKENILNRQSLSHMQDLIAESTAATLDLQLSSSSSSIAQNQ